jgi:hypothetical protein
MGRAHFFQPAKWQNVVKLPLVELTGKDAAGTCMDRKSSRRYVGLGSVLAAWPQIPDI